MYFQRLDSAKQDHRITAASKSKMQDLKDVKTDFSYLWRFTKDIVIEKGNRLSVHQIGKLETVIFTANELKRDKMETVGFEPIWGRNYWLKKSYPVKKSLESSSASTLVSRVSRTGLTPKRVRVPMPKLEK